MSFLLISCANFPEEIIVEKPTPVLPPLDNLSYCAIPKTSSRIEDVIDRLARLVECERADKDALRAWRRRFEPPVQTIRSVSG